MLSTMHHVLVTSCMQTLPRTNGVSSHSVLNSSQYSNVVDDLSPDIMQDVLEGTLELLEAKVLESSEKWGKSVGHSGSGSTEVCSVADRCVIHRRGDGKLLL